MITLVLGGTRSGKSEVAERLAGRLSPPVTYLATTVVPDDDADMAARVERHRRRRPPSWRTLEAGAGLVPALEQVSGSVVVDSLGAWVAACEARPPDADALTQSLRARTGDAVVVSDEVGLGVHPSSEVGRRFRDALGEVNRAVADIADEVLLVVAGRVLPLDPLPADERQEGS